MKPCTFISTRLSLVRFTSCVSCILFFITQLCCKCHFSPAETLLGRTMLCLAAKAAIRKRHLSEKACHQCSLPPCNVGTIPRLLSSHVRIRPPHSPGLVYSSALQDLRGTGEQHRMPAACTLASPLTQHTATVSAPCPLLAFIMSPLHGSLYRLGP